jgi:hypothetical protein
MSPDILVLIFCGGQWRSSLCVCTMFFEVDSGISVFLNNFKSVIDTVNTYNKTSNPHVTVVLLLSCNGLNKNYTEQKQSILW